MAAGRRWLTVGLGVLVAGTLVGPARADSETVLLKGTKFDPKTVEVKPGDTVVWKYDSGERHSVTFEDGTEVGCTRGLLSENCIDQPGETRSRTFSQIDVFPYYCRFHGGPGGQGMSGVVKVLSTATTVVATSTSTIRPSTTTTTAKPSTTTTTRPLATSSTVISTTTTQAAALPPTTLTPNEPPPFDPADPGGSTTDPSGERAASEKEHRGDSSAVTLIVALLLGVAAGGGFLLWRLRPGRGAPPPGP